MADKGAILARQKERPIGSLLCRLTESNHVGLFALIAFLAGITVIAIQRPFTPAERGDLAIWDYVSQSILRGQIPYRDVIEIKTPLSAYISAVAIAAGRMV